RSCHTRALAPTPSPTGIATGATTRTQWTPMGTLLTAELKCTKNRRYRNVNVWRMPLAAIKRTKCFATLVNATRSLCARFSQRTCLTRTIQSTIIERSTPRTMRGRSRGDIR
ncbi:hypothetical protein GGI21_006546, partial [Coemansia aciculifera]